MARGYSDFDELAAERAPAKCQSALFGIRFGLLATRAVKVQNHSNFVAVQQFRCTSVALLYKAVPDALPALELP